MARVRFNPVFTEIHGKLGDFIVKQRDGRFYISQRPDYSKRVLSPVQKETNARFRAAVQYAKHVIADPEAKRQYKDSAEQSGKSVYSVAIADYMGRHKQGDSCLPVSV